ncbi:hypothetical protein [Pseudonocardia sp. ICBG1293]|uniref:hypothetical protein n=1 Tax=Pseudonocardia sp. ICBG1293 TaxID=2844382 RepID=UPI001CCEFBC7|nr:hypothetical protein [Pseudonocardia sp. ICBG1293]
MSTVDTGAGAARGVPGPARPPHRVLVAQFVGSLTDGAVLATAVLYATTRIGVGAATVGVVLATAAAAALVLSVPIGMLADRVGLGRAATGLGAVAAAGLLLHAGAGGTAGYAAGAVCFAVGQAGLSAVRQAVAVSAVAPAARRPGRPHWPACPTARTASTRRCSARRRRWPGSSGRRSHSPPSWPAGPSAGSGWVW